MMRAPGLKPLLIAAAGTLIAGCTTPVPVASHAIRCDVDAKLLESRCLSPKQVPEDATFQTLVDTMLADRQALKECGATADALRDSIKRCNQATDDFNKKIDALNKSDMKH